MPIPSTTTASAAALIAALGVPLALAADPPGALPGDQALTCEQIYAQVDARVHDDPAEWPGLLSAQLCSPVRWRQTLETFAGLGLTSLVELGPGGVLSGFRRIVSLVRSSDAGVRT